MFSINKVLISPRALEYLKKRKLEKQYQKAKLFILGGFFNNVDFKLREPKEDEIWYFRINKQYRAICTIERDTLYIYAIDNHQ